MNRITINGVTITTSGNNISVVNGKVMVDGEVIKEGLSGEVVIKWEGELANLESHGSVYCGDVKGNVSVGGSLHCEDISGSVNVGGSVRCGAVGGMINAGGSVRHG